MSARRALPEELDINPATTQAAFAAARRAARGYIDDVDDWTPARRMATEAVAVATPAISAPLASTFTRKTSKNRKNRLFLLPMAAALSAVAGIGAFSPGVAAASTADAKGYTVITDAEVAQQNTGSVTSRSVGRTGQTVARGTVNSVEVPQAPAAVELSVSAALEPEVDATADAGMSAESIDVATSAAAEIAAEAADQGETAKPETAQRVLDPAAGDAVPASGGILQRPVGGAIISNFGYRIHPVYGTSRMHEGVDFSNACGTPILAAQSGKVTMASYSGGAGNMVQIDGGSVDTVYMHLSRFGVSSGQQVSRGEVIGYVGTTGTSTGCHLHFGVQKDGNYTDPVPYL